jgi:hypothetical protein
VLISAPVIEQENEYVPIGKFIDSFANMARDKAGKRMDVEVREYPVCALEDPIDACPLL